MKLESIKEIKICYDEKEVNEKLEKGYIIQKIIQAKINGDSLTPCFIMAK